MDGGEMITERQLKVYRRELSPVDFLERSGLAHAGRVAVVDGGVSYTYAEWRDRSRRFASALRSAGLEKDDRVAFLALNSEPLLLAHFAVPQAGGALVAINTRLSPDEVAYVVEHSESRLLFHSPELTPQLAALPEGVRTIELGADFEAFLAEGGDG